MSSWYLQIDTKTNEIEKDVKKSSVRESKQNHPISGIKCPYFLICILFRFLEARAEKFHWFFGRLEDTKRIFQN